MSNTKSTTRKPTVVFGAPVDELPAIPARVGSSKPSEHWQSIAEHVKANPGKWHTVTLKGYGIPTHRSAVARIKNACKPGLPSAQRLVSFAEPGFDAAFRDGMLYVRYDAPAVAKKRIGSAA